MTLVVAFLCTDGAVLAADSMLTGSLGGIGTAHIRGKKVYTLAGPQLFAYSGDQGFAGRFRALADQRAAQIAPSATPLDYCNGTTIAVGQQFINTGAMSVRPQGGVNEIDLNVALAFAHAGTVHCCFFNGQMQPWLLDVNHYYLALGSGKIGADPFLRFLVDTFCTKQPSVSEAIFLCRWALEHVIETNTGGVGGEVRIAELKASPAGIVARELDVAEIEEGKQAIQDARATLRKWRDSIGGQAPLPLGTPPMPAPAPDANENPPAAADQPAPAPQA